MSHAVHPQNPEMTLNPADSGHSTFQCKASDCRHVAGCTENAETLDLVRFPFILHVSIPGMNIWWLGCKTRVVLSARTLGRDEGRSLHPNLSPGVDILWVV